jgi:hypothetical protein
LLEARRDINDEFSSDYDVAFFLMRVLYRVFLESH